MIDDPLRAWAIEAWKKEVLRNVPSAKLVRQLKASQRESQRSMARARRSMLAQQAASQRKLNQRLSDLEKLSRERREALARELEEKQWSILMGKSSS